MFRMPVFSLPSLLPRPLHGRSRPRPKGPRRSAACFLLIVVAFGAAAAGRVLALQAPPPQPLPRAVVEQATKDLGMVALGTDPEATFTIENRGGSPLEIVVTPVPTGLRVVHA